MPVLHFNDSDYQVQKREVLRDKNIITQTV